MTRLLARDLQSRNAPEIIRLQALGRAAVGPLALLLRDPTSPEQLRSWSAYLLRRIGHADGVPHLVGALDDPSWRVRKNAANSLGALGKPEVIGRLLRLMTDPIRTVSQSAAAAVNKLSTAEHLPLLRAALRVQQDGEIRARLIHLIGQLTLPAARTLLLRALTDPHPKCRGYAIYYLVSHSPDALHGHLERLLGDADPSVRVMALRALPLLGRPIPLKAALKRLFEPEAEVRREAASALLFFDRPEIQSALMAALAIERRTEVRLGLASAIGRTRPLTAYAEFLATIEDRTQPDSLRAQALYALSHLPLRLTISTLIAALEHRSQLQRQVARAQLQLLTGQRFADASGYARWWQATRKQFVFPREMHRPRHAGQMRHWKTAHYTLTTDVDALLAERIMLTMELMHQTYNRLYAAPTPLESHAAKRLLALGAKRTRTEEGTLFSIPGGARVLHMPDGQRRAWYPDGRRVTLRPDGSRQIRFPWGPTVVTRRYSSPTARPTRIKLFLHRRGYRNYASKTDPKWPFLQDAGGYYSPTRQEIVTYSKPSRASVLNTMAHEAQHQVLATHLRRAPVWLNEGLSEYYEQSTLEGGLLRRQTHTAHLNFVARLLRERSHVPLRNLLRLDYNTFHNDSFGPAEIGHYAQSWSLVYFLLEAERGRYRQLLRRYFDALRDGASSSKAFTHYLKLDGLDWAALEKRWRAYILQLARAQKKSPRPQGGK